MEIREEFVKRYWDQIVRDQVIDDWEKKGFNVTTEKKLGDDVADIYAVKEERKIIIEIVTSKKDRSTYARLQRLAKEQGAEMMLVMANFENEKALVDIDNIEMILLDYLHNGNTPSSVDALGHHCQIENIREVRFVEVNVLAEYIWARGKCICDVEICLDKEEECKIKMPFPAEFDCNLSYNPGLQISEMEDFEVDTSAYYK